jgi:formate dehydrogenase subunit gamma
VTAQRVIHWIGVASFLALLLTGLPLLVPPLGVLAAGGLSRLIHRLAAIAFVVLPIAYAVLLPRETRELLSESLRYTRQDLAWLRCMARYMSGRVCGVPPQGRLNAGQKLHHAATFLGFVTVSASGFVLWFGTGRLGPDLLAATLIVHDLSLVGVAVLMIGHVYFTFLYGAWPAMRTGFVTETYARLEHRRWLETLPPEAFVAAPGSSNGRTAGSTDTVTTGE